MSERANGKITGLRHSTLGKTRSRKITTTPYYEEFPKPTYQEIALYIRPTVASLLIRRYISTGKFITDQEHNLQEGIDPTAREILS